MIVDGSSADAIAHASKVLRSGGVLGMPTETVYGLAANADDALAVAKIFTAKGRPADHPLIVHVADASGVDHYASTVPGYARALMQMFWPGPLTLILPRREGVAKEAAGGQDSVGLRCPSHPVAQALLRNVLHDQKPVWGIAAPSANRFGRVSPTTAAHVENELGADLLVLDGGACEVGIESAIVDCTRGRPVLLRPGQLTRAQLEAACGQTVWMETEIEASPAPRASGTLESHYAPQAKVRLMDAKGLQTALDLLGADVDGKTPSGPVIATWSRVILKSRSEKILRRRMPDDAAITAQQLFAVLREFDAQGVKLIWIEAPPDSPDWDGVRDRLQRAAA